MHFSPVQRPIIPRSHLRGQAVVLCEFCERLFCRQKVAVVVRKVAEGLRFDCDQYGCFPVFAAVYLRFPAVLCAVVEPRLELHTCGGACL